MRPQQMAVLGDSIFPWTSRSASICWGCALEQRSRMSYRRFGTELQGRKIGPRRHGSRFTTASSGHGGFLTLHKTLTTGRPVEWSDGGRSLAKVDSKPAGITIPFFSAELDRPYGGAGRGKRLRRGGTHESSNTRAGASFNLQPPKPSRVSNQSDSGLRKSHLPQNELLVSKHGKKVPSPTGESDQTLDAVLNYWLAQKNISSGKPLHGLPAPNVRCSTGDIRPGWGLGGLVSRVVPFIQVQTASAQRYESRRLYSTKALPLEARRSIRTVSARFAAAAPHQQSITRGDLPVNLLPRFEVGSNTPIRNHLKLWQEQNQDEEMDVKLRIAKHGKPGGLENMLTRPADRDTILDTTDNEENEGAWPEASMDHDGVTNFDSETPFLRCGDLVELSPSNGNHESVLAIYIRTFETQSQFYTMYGKWVHQLSRVCYFSIPGFVSPNLVTEILPYLPSQEVDDELKDQLHAFDVGVPREVGSPIINQIRHFFSASEAVYRTHSSSLDNAHDIVAHETETRYMTLPEIATRVLPPRAKKIQSDPWPQSTLYALHRILIRNEFGFVTDRSGHRVSALFEIRPKQEVESVNQVRFWFREYQEKLVTAAATDKSDTTSSNAADTHPLASFVRTARRLIQESREDRVPTKEGNVGPSRVRFAEESNFTFKTVPSIRFSETDKSIIRFFEVWAGYRSFFRHVPLNSLASMILRLIGTYEGYDLDYAVGWLFLQELGVYAPWENRMVLNHKLGLPGHQIALKADELRLENIRAAKSTTVMEDTMKAYRKDFGDLEVFCVDDVDAKEIDDGISVEEIPGSETIYWIHVHVANPSAFISPESPLARYAEYITETVYLPERIYPMLPKNITSAQWSLAPNRPTLTFSAKVNRDGDLLEAKIRPGYIRKVSYCTPETIREAVGGGGRPVSGTVITVGGNMPSRGRRGMQQTLTKSQKSKLRILRDLGNARRRQRERKGAVNVSLPMADTAVYLNARQDSPLSLTNRTRGYHYIGDPIIQLRGDYFNPKPDPATSSADKLVPDMMVLAGEAAALWCKERNIPTIYRATQRHPDHDPNTFKEEVMRPIIEKLGYVPLVLSFRYSRLLGRSHVSTTPRPHGIIGTDQYAKCTSPLRRYGDLLVHWQIESAIRREAEIGQTLVGSRDQSYLTFSKERFDEMIPRVESRERMIMGLKRHSLRHWTMQVLFRAFYFKEAALPETFECFIFSKGASKYMGMYSGILKELGIDVQVEPNESIKADEVGVGDWWEVRLVKVDLYVRSATVTTVRLIEKGEDYSI